MRFKLTGLVGGFLLAMALILGLFFNMLLGSTTGSYAEKHVEDLARMMIVSLEALRTLGRTSWSLRPLHHIHDRTAQHRVTMRLLDEFYGDFRL